MAATASSLGPPRRSRAERFGPLIQLAVALLLVVVLLPSVLRPPQQNPPGTPQLSPDAPPDENVDSIIAALNQGRSSTAGGGLGDGLGLPADVPVPARKPRACPFGFGNPPRQVESVYSPACAPAFVGDNGGATARGVTRTAIRIAVTMHNDRSRDGWVTDEMREGETDWERVWRIFRQYFNSRFQLYGRRLEIYGKKYTVPTSQAAVDAAAERAIAQDMVRASDPFAATLYNGGGGQGAGMYDELSRQGVLHWGSYNYARDFYQRSAPRAWSFHMDGTKLTGLGAEYVCKKLAGKKAEFAGDELNPVQNYESRTRKFGMIYDDNSATNSSPGRDMQPLLKQQCGVTTVNASYDQSQPDGGASQYNLAIDQMRSADVTTVLYLGAPGLARIILGDAQRKQYYPEWVVLGQAEIDKSARGREINEAQWSHAFGLSAGELPRPLPEQDWYKAYREVDPDAPLDAAVVAFGDWYWFQLIKLVSGIQLAGPNLTHKSFEQALFAAGKRPPDPVYSIGGGFAPGDYTFADDVAEIWWDPEGYDPASPGIAGAYRYTGNGRRYEPGQIPSNTSELFRSGLTASPG